MSRFRKRDDHTHWWNSSSVNDVHEAIEILQQTGTTLRDTHLAKRKDGTYEIKVPWAREGSSGGDTSGTTYYEVTTEIGDRLIAEHLVTARRVPRWGYTETIKGELVLTTAANRQLEEFMKAMRTKAESLLVPGIHTDLAGKPKELGRSRDDLHSGSLYFEYELPQNGGKVRVYPEQDRVVMPETASA